MESLFDEDDARKLEASGLITKIIHGRRAVCDSLIRSSSHQNPPSHRSKSNMQTVLPAYINSVEAYQYLGFDAATSWELFQQFVTPSSSTDPVFTFLDLAIRHIECALNAFNSPNSAAGWVHAMNYIGISREFQKRVMGPQFEFYRLKASLRSILVTIVKSNMRLLERVQGDSRQRQGRLFLSQALALG